MRHSDECQNPSYSCSVAIQHYVFNKPFVLVQMVREQTHLLSQDGFLLMPE
jgi:hypothetical protein